MRNWLLKHLYKAVTARDLLDSHGKLKDHKKQQYKAEAKAMLESEVNLWIKDELERQAMKKMYQKSKTVEDMIFSKAMLHSENVRMATLKEIANS